jgi:hypothetical protein
MCGPKFCSMKISGQLDELAGREAHKASCEAAGKPVPAG